ncbi:MAG: DsbA family protein, partial [Bacteroides sp.]|nr:DsbA family protein [Bacteroides sp.]
ITYFIDLAIALVASNGMFKNIVQSFKTTFVDFIAGAKKYTKTFIVLVLLTVSFLAYSRITYNFVPHIKKHQDILKYRKIKHNPYRVKGNILGNEKGNVVIELYSDYVCPLCYIQNIMLHQAAKEFTNIRINHHNFPFDKECNPYIQVNMHPHACFMSKAAIAARNQGNYWEMSSLLYEKQPTKINDVLKLVEEAGLDKDKFMQDFDTQAARDEIARELEEAQRLELDSTPTMIIDGEEIVGVKPYFELKELLIKHGAKRK